MTPWTLLAWLLQALVVFVASTFLFDALHWLLHRWSRSRSRLLRRFSRWHWVHHRFLDRRMRVNRQYLWPNLFLHVLPEYVTAMAGTLLFLLVFPWQPVVVVGLIRTVMFVFTIKEEGMDANHMSMERIGGRQGAWWINQSYHAMHHVHPNSFFSSFANMFDMLFGTAAQIRNRRFLITGASGAFGSALKSRLEKLGAIVETARHREDFGPGDYARMDAKLANADVLVLSHGAKSDGCQAANCDTFVGLIDRFLKLHQSSLTPPEVWALGSEAEFHGDMGMPELVDYAASKRAFARHAVGYYRRDDVLYRHIVPCAFKSAMGPGPISADTAAAIALFFIRRGFHYVPVTVTSLAFWNFFRFIRQKPLGAATG